MMLPKASFVNLATIIFLSINDVHSHVVRTNALEPGLFDAFLPSQSADGGGGPLGFLGSIGQVANPTNFVDTIEKAVNPMNFLNAVVPKATSAPNIFSFLSPQPAMNPLQLIMGVLQKFLAMIFQMMLKPIIDPLNMLGSVGTVAKAMDPLNLLGTFTSFASAMDPTGVLKTVNKFANVMDPNNLVGMIDKTVDTVTKTMTDPKQIANAVQTVNKVAKTVADPTKIANTLENTIDMVSNAVDPANVVKAIDSVASTMSDPSKLVGTVTKAMTDPVGTVTKAVSDPSSVLGSFAKVVDPFNVMGVFQPKPETKLF